MTEMAGIEPKHFLWEVRDRVAIHLVRLQGILDD